MIPDPIYPTRGVWDEARQSRDKYGPYASSHEAFGVLAEEVAELLSAIHSNDPNAIARESTQVAAVALRLSWEILNETSTIERSGCQHSA